MAANGTRPARIGLVLTGGTVGSELRRYADETVVSLAASGDGLPFGLRLVRSAVPAGAYDFVTESPMTLASEDMRPAHWRTIADAVLRLVDAGLSRVLILHGTDTMTFTSAALSFLLSDVDATVVLTGANLPPGQAGTDARKNIHDALIAAGHLPRGTYLAFAGGADLPGIVHLGTQVRKVQTYGQSFQSVNRRPVASVAGSVFTWLDRWTPTSAAGAHRAALCDADDRVLSFRLYPGLNFDAMRAVLDAGRCRAVVIELYAAVTGPNSEGGYALPAFVARCRSDGVGVFLTASSPMTEKANIYDSYVAARDAGGVFLPGTIPETAIVKCMWVLGRTDDPATVVELMSTPVAGEVDFAHAGRVFAPRPLRRT